jgi:ubiquinone/menaquinone biosynthesis C-methylase UbiE
VSSAPAATTADVREYWNRHIHDLEITQHPVGTPGFFVDLDQYHFEKLHHLPRLVAFDGYRGKQVLEVGCGAGTDLVRFARGGAVVTGVDIAPSAIALARQNFAQQGLPADLREADGERLPFAAESFDRPASRWVGKAQRRIARASRKLRPV